MYFDEDGSATKRSHAVYDARMRILLSTTLLLSWLGFGAAVLNDEYTGEYVSYLPSLKQLGLLQWSKFLWPLLSFHSLSLQWKEDPVRTYTAGLRGSLLSILIISSKLLATDQNGEKPFFAVSWTFLQLFIAVLLAITQVLFPRRPDLFTPEGKLVDHEKSSSALSRYTMHWCTSALVLAGKGVTLEELPVLDSLTRSKSQPLLVIDSPDTTLWDRIFAERYLGFVKQWILLFARSMAFFGSPYCVMRLLKSLEDNRGRTDDAWVWLIGIGGFSICQTIVNYHLILIQWSEMAIPVRAQLIMAIFRKALRMKDTKDQQKTDLKSSNAAREKPEAISLISSDTLTLSKFTAMSYIIPSSILRYLFALLFLLNLLGWQSALVGTIVTLLCVPVNTYIMKQPRVAQKHLVAARDEKTKAISEALYALRQIKFSALETQWEEHIETFRKEEIKYLGRSFSAINIRLVWGVVAPMTVATASIGAYTYFHKAISPSIIFPLIEVLPHLQGALGIIPLVVQDYISARSNASRLEDFLRRPEQGKILNPSPSGCVSFQNASIAWPSSYGVAETEFSREKKQSITQSIHRFTLSGINLEFPAGELSIISGKTGSGKSLLLAAIIGEVDVLSGRINAPSMAEEQPVAFVSQIPWLQNASIRDNILFGSPFDKERYEKVLKACALHPDLAALAKGDETQVGLRGVKLSGGQRVRLAFGRALYSSAQLLVLDDIFSALDSHVSKEILNALTGELCQSRTRILVTHQVQLCLPKSKYIAHLKNNTIGYAGNTDSIQRGIDVIETEIQLVSEPPMEEKPEADTDNKKPKTRLVLTENKKFNRRADLNLYKTYFSAAGGPVFTFLYLLGLFTKQLLGALRTWLLGRINSTRGPEVVSDKPEKVLPFSSNGLQQYFYLYLGSSLLAVIFEFIINLHTFSGSIRASEVLFHEMTARVIRMPILWLDSTPIGDLLKRFTVDTKMLDDSVFDTLSEFANCFIKLLIIVGFGLHTSKYTSFLTAALLFWCAQITSRYIKARSTIKRADEIPTADILEHLTSSTAGISTIRAFGAVDKSVDQMHLYLDSLSKVKRHFWVFNRWVALQMSFVGILFSMGTGIILLSSKSFVDTSLVGFSLTFSMGFSQAIFKVVNNFGHLETAMDAAGVITEYVDLETEEQGGNEVPENWPSKGQVEFKGLDIAYSAALPLVLKDVSFTAQAGKRIGIVGRTGAGKSSLALSLLRLINPRRGSIHIDGIDISTIKLRDLRTRIAFIPQDPVLFSGTVRSNLDYFKHVAEEDLTEALRRVKLLADEGDKKSDSFSLDSPISASGLNISQGQRQLLCLARVLLKKPMVTILDEATSAVDNKTDLLIQDMIKRDLTGTLIVVAHRLRTIAGFDQVIVMNDGKVVESGRPDMLLEEKGMFYDLVMNSQDTEFFTQR